MHGRSFWTQVQLKAKMWQCLQRFSLRQIRCWWLFMYKMCSVLTIKPRIHSLSLRWTGLGGIHYASVHWLKVCPHDNGSSQNFVHAVFFSGLNNNYFGWPASSARLIKRLDKEHNSAGINSSTHTVWERIHSSEKATCIAFQLNNVYCPWEQGHWKPNCECLNSYIVNLRSCVYESVLNSFLGLIFGPFSLGLILINETFF